MASRDEQNTGFSIGFLNLVQILLIILKLTDTISWSWWLVLTPLIFEISVGIMLMIILVIVIILSGK